MTTTKKPYEPGWTAPFLAALRAGNDIGDATAMAGVTIANARLRRRRHSDFAQAWDAAVAPRELAARVVAAPPPGVAPTTRRAARLDRFLAELAETSNVTAAAAVADLAVSTIYKLRRESAEFAQRWYAALAEGYDNLEMELLGHLRAGDDGDLSARKGKFDTAAALRCLAAHRDSVAREKGRRTLAEEVATIASINDKIDRLRLAEQEGRRAIAAARKAKARAALPAAAGDAAGAAAGALPPPQDDASHAG